MPDIIEPTREVSQRIFGAVRAGGYPYIAAEAYGVAKAVFDDWLAKGNGAGAAEPYRELATGVRQAAAHARLIAEIASHGSDPKIWLVNGPGRETLERPGWSVCVRPMASARHGRNAFDDFECMRLVQFVLNVLEPIPDVRLRMADKLKELNFKISKESSDGETSA